MIGIGGPLKVLLYVMAVACTAGGLNLKLSNELCVRNLPISAALYVMSSTTLSNFPCHASTPSRGINTVSHGGKGNRYIA